jgi:hypothetical protein
MGREPPSNLERSFSADDLIQLPRFDAVGAVTLGERLLAVANAEAELPRPIRRAKEALEEDLSTLRLAAQTRLAAAATAGAPAMVAEADRSLDECWTALHDWLTGFSRLPGGYPECGEARALLEELYPDGLSFILLPYELEWKQSDDRLTRIANETLGERIKKLGGAVFIEALVAAHASYGKLLGLPRLAPSKEGGAQTVGEALEGFASTLRVYALKVTAVVEVDEPETAALSKRLLEPLLSWRSSPRPWGDGELTFA